MVIACVAPPALIALFAVLKVFTAYYWVGRCDLEIAFEVVDKVTGKPIPSAKIAIAGQDGLCHCDGEEDTWGKKEYSLVTDEEGLARQPCTSCLTCGVADLFSRTWSTSVPLWSFKVSADKYESTEQRLNHYSHLAVRPHGDQKTARLTVTVKLNKCPGP
jgi:hypothetical protein